MVKPLIFLLAACIGLSSSPYKPIPFAPATALEDAPCSLPAPKNVQIEVTGPTFFQISWNAVPDAAYYRVNFYIYSTGKLAGTKLVPAQPQNNRTMVLGLPVASTFSVSIFSICSNGSQSPKTF